MAYLTPLRGIPSERPENRRPTRATARESDRRFEVLAEFEAMMRDYEGVEAPATA